MKAKELAELLGVSPATVSLVLNNKPGLSDSLRHELIERINAMGCGEMLATKSEPQADKASYHKQTIAYLIYTSAASGNDRFSFYPSVLEGSEMEARDNNFTLLVYHVSPHGNNNLPSLLKNSRAVGAIVQTSCITAPIIEDLKGIGLPTVFIDSYRPDLNCSSVCINNEQGMYSAVRYLKEMGHAKIGYISSGSDSDSTLERRKFFHMALRAYEIEDKRENYYNSRGESEDACFNLKEIWDKTPPKVTALVCEHDFIAWRALIALRKCGYDVPDDISLIGFDNRSIAEMTEPKLTSVNNHRQLMGREAVMMLQNKIRLNRLGFKNTAMKFELPTEFIIRESVKDLNSGG